jgi:hypothetical protein
MRGSNGAYFLSPHRLLIFEMSEAETATSLVGAFGSGIREK